ncbi:MAG: VOC family protein [Patescibacteria group bacterium]|nr:VOC family protein [Patescibacteria group bacterium]
MNRIIHFEIHASDPIKIADFYASVFGWKIEEWIPEGVEKMEDENRYWMITTGGEKEPGINGGLMFRRGEKPKEKQAVNSYVCTIDVKSLDDMVTKVQDAGGALDVPRMPIKGMGWLAYCKDPDGNIFGMMENDKNAE